MNMPNADEKDHPKNSKPSSLLATVITGMGTGSFCAGFFNPWDRALYLSVSNNKPFLTVAKEMVNEAIANKSLIHPLYQGALQAILQRSFSWGSYYILQEQGKLYLNPFLQNQGLSNAQAQFGVGIFAGSISGAITNPLSAIKSYLWKTKDSTFFSSAKTMWSTGGIKPFLKGTTATISRDTIFGSFYEIIRTASLSHLQKNKNCDEKPKFTVNLFSAGIATVASAPLNFIRTLQYDTPPNQKPPSSSQALHSLWVEINNKKTLLDKAKHTQQRLRIGWGTARVAAGMGAGQLVFDYSNEWLTTCLKK